ncbi:hypothetical protein BV321_05407 [Pseudomonas syringae pv. actinidiae]|nr:hypothetical protein BV343_05344 [Pseudomonas syringae pv. actinidiae]OSN34688.1 hypothetical protein BV344_05349 [Pseudomonas syringae pv. actinidiae]OSR31153.1 hypothetical protein BV320_05383 [Pseudomonas syringae pv. actinidiae]OSR31334.1 hypothetical protein BV321_05407 [Pseudomonas syringae pv. actinidiae]OSR31346.1 hypothetical protein BV322_05405 [Pseudomonas syringae pv. actinidiae]
MWFAKWSGYRLCRNFKACRPKQFGHYATCSCILRELQFTFGNRYRIVGYWINDPQVTWIAIFNANAETNRWPVCLGGNLIESFWDTPEPI